MNTRYLFCFLFYVAMQMGASAYGQYRDGCTLLCEAAKGGDLERLEMLICRGADVDWADYGQLTPLYWASANGRTGCVHALLKAGARVDGLAAELDSPLRVAVAKGHFEVVEALIDAKADVDHLVQGVSLLALAINREDLKMVELLIAAKADLNKPSMIGNAYIDPFLGPATPLYWAIYNSCIDVARALLQAGAHPNGLNGVCIMQELGPDATCLG
ncbi:MAG TPA: ankyrin repeat domain-containing protein, partial [Opitutales bacterium]|nr:ankyrin repeat domain-containing protein [Opitutales bacterium]